MAETTLTMSIDASPAASSGLRQRLRAARRRSQARMILLATPLILYTILGFIAPLVLMLVRSVDNSLLSARFERTAEALADWDKETVPDIALEALLADLQRIEAEGKTALVGKNLNYEHDGFRSLLVTTVRELAAGQWSAPPDQLRQIDGRWAQIEYWQVLQRATKPYTWRNLLAAVDLKQTPAGKLVRAGVEARIHVAILLRTILVSVAVCGLCLVLGLPVALILASVRDRVRNLLLILVMLPFWTPVLVRTTAWIVLLQNEGVLNHALTATGLIAAPLPLMYSRTGVMVAMTHVLLPYMILPIYVAMKSVPASYVRASLSLGAPPMTTIRRVYLPLIAPGIRSGCVLVFVLALGYYITPALVGGPSDQMFSYLIAFHTSTTLNWGMAAALSMVLLVSVGALFLAIVKLLGPVKVSLEAGR
jgi:putative spermidine/putrescine transport system permease protein